MNKKKIIIFLLLFFCFKNVSSLTNHNEFIHLKDEVLHVLDGIKEAMDGAAIWDIERVRYSIRIMEMGKKDKKSKSYVGQFEFEGKKVTLKELAEIEVEAEKNKDLEKIQSLKPILNEAIERFIKSTVEFLEKSKDTKHLVIKLMEESCQRRNRMNSTILTWAETDGNEEAMFKKNVTSIQALNTFFKDLSDFLGDLIVSCPKGYAQFKKMLREQK